MTVLGVNTYHGDVLAVLVRWWGSRLLEGDGLSSSQTLDGVCARGNPREPGILRIQPTAPVDSIHLREQVMRLEALAAQGDSQAAVAQLSEIVPTFQFQQAARHAASGF